MNFKITTWTENRDSESLVEGTSRSLNLHREATLEGSFWQVLTRKPSRCYVIKYVIKFVKDCQGLLQRRPRTRKVSVLVVT